MKGAAAVYCRGPRARWGPQRRALRVTLKANRWIAAALLVALALAVAALLAADPAAAHTAGSVGLVGV